MPFLSAVEPPPLSSTTTTTMTALEIKQRKERGKSIRWGRRFCSKKSRSSRSSLARHPLLAAQQRFSFSSRNSRNNPDTKPPVSIDATTLAVIRLEVEEMLANGGAAPVTILSLANALVGCSHVLDVHAAAAEDILQDDNEALDSPERRFRAWGSFCRASRDAASQLEERKTQRKYDLLHCFQKLHQQTGAATTPIACWKAAVAALDSVLILPEESQPEEEDVTDENKTNKNHRKTTTKTDTTMADFQKRLQDIRLEETMGLRPSQHQWQQVMAQSSLFSRKHDDAAPWASDQRRLAEEQAARKDRLQPPELRQIEEQQEREARAAAARERAASLLRALSPGRTRPHRHRDADGRRRRRAGGNRNGRVQPPQPADAAARRVGQRRGHSLLSRHAGKAGREHVCQRPEAPPLALFQIVFHDPAAQRVQRRQSRRVHVPERQALVEKGAG